MEQQSRVNIYLLLFTYSLTLKYNVHKFTLILCLMSHENDVKLPINFILLLAYIVLKGILLFNLLIHI